LFPFVKTKQILGIAFTDHCFYSINLHKVAIHSDYLDPEGIKVTLPGKDKPAVGLGSQVDQFQQLIQAEGVPGLLPFEFCWIIVRKHEQLFSCFEE